ncbi:MAG: 1-acyl-sn-glycerol-3-phosphate acyltransferase [Myxococcales bacterium]
MPATTASSSPRRHWISGIQRHQPIEPVIEGATIASDVEQRVLALLTHGGRPLDDVLRETIYHERQRLNGPATRRQAVDQRLLERLRQALPSADARHQEELVRLVVRHYLTEISGHFDPRVYRLATRVMPPALGALLHGISLHNRDVFYVGNRISISGRVASLCKLSARGTILLVPTHVSNLDSVILGWALSNFGLRPFAYGAGLNLFERPLLGFFMQHLGAYTVDRSKHDPLYRWTLKEYATALLEHGQHSLFFPGGTRSRSGALETRLKLGLLGTGIEAMRRCAEQGRPRRVFVVPCTLTYPLVLEAESLIRDFLRTEGGPQYFEGPDESEHLQRWVELIRGLYRLDLQVHLRFGAALDPIGNEVDDEGRSQDPSGRLVDPLDYLRATSDSSEVRLDPERDAEYTRLLSARILAAYPRDVVAVSTSVAAHAIFELLTEASRERSVFRMLQEIPPSVPLTLDAITARIARSLPALEAAEQRGEITRAEIVRRGSPGVILEKAIATFATYHHERIASREGELLRIHRPDLVYYYQNRVAPHLSSSSSGGSP